MEEPERMHEELLRAYAVLEVEPGSPLPQVRQSYLDLVRIWHPDRFQHEAPRVRQRAEEKLKEITLAWEVLRDTAAPTATGAPCAADGSDLVPLDFGEHWGYVDVRGRTVIHPEFLAARPFREGLAAVLLVDRWGFITPAGEMQIAPAFSECGDFSEGLAAARWYNRWGYIDRTGAFVIPPRFQEAGAFLNGEAEVKLGIRYGTVNRSGEVAFPVNRLG